MEAVRFRRVSQLARAVAAIVHGVTEVPRTKLQPRAVRVVHKLRVAVVAGVDLGVAVAPDDDATITIGTSADNTLVLTDPVVSRYHLELRRAPAGIEVVDLGSRNGTWLGAVRLERAIVPAGTRLRLGDTTIAVADAGSPLAPPTPSRRGSPSWSATAKRFARSRGSCIDSRASTRRC